MLFGTVSNACYGFYESLPRAVHEEGYCSKRDQSFSSAADPMIIRELLYM